MLFEYTEKSTILFKPRALHTFLFYMQKRDHDAEAGGYLIGEQYKNQFVINVATPPGREDKRRRFSITRCHIRGQTILDLIWKRSLKKKVLMGEWHTHPEHSPSPSTTDIRGIELAFKNNKFPLGFMMIVIVSNHSISKSWFGIRDNRGIRRLNRIGYKLWQG